MQNIRSKKFKAGNKSHDHDFNDHWDYRDQELTNDQFTSDRHDQFTNDQHDQFTSDRHDQFTSDRHDQFTSDRHDQFTSDRHDQFTSDRHGQVITRDQHDQSTSDKHGQQCEEEITGDVFVLQLLLFKTCVCLCFTWYVVIKGACIILLVCTCYQVYIIL